jgi:hypothetical protein
MESLEPWMLIIGLLSIVYAVMVVLWVVAWKTSPKTIFGPLVLDHKTRPVEPAVEKSFLQKWLRRLTTI